jgi:hypothetical protein
MEDCWPCCTATCLSLGLNTPYPNNDTDDRNKLLEDVEVCITLLLTLHVVKLK